MGAKGCFQSSGLGHCVLEADTDGTLHMPVFKAQWMSLGVSLSDPSHVEEDLGNNLSSLFWVT